MAIYATARKFEETNEYVIYVCGDSPDRLYHKFKIDKFVLDYQTSVAVKDVVTPLSENADTLCIMQVFGKILRYYRDNGVFPDKATKES